jgi:hypothetical protein
MPEARQLLPGFNHNVRHQGRLYHVQTEASATASALVATHLFLGGNVVAAKKTSYAELLGADDLAARVKKLMEAQHKEMLRELVRGSFDSAVQARAYAPGELDDEAVVGADAAPPVAAEPPSVAPEPTPAAPEPTPAAAAAEPPAAAERGAPQEVVDVVHVSELSPVLPPPARAAAPRGAGHAATAAPHADGWGPPVLPRVQRAAPSPAAAPPQQPAPAAGAAPDRSLDELVLAYLAEDVGSKRERDR